MILIQPLTLKRVFHFNTQIILYYLKFCFNVIPPNFQCLIIIFLTFILRILYFKVPSFVFLCFKVYGYIDSFIMRFHGRGHRMSSDDEFVILCHVHVGRI